MAILNIISFFDIPKEYLKDFQFPEKKWEKISKSLDNLRTTFGEENKSFQANHELLKLMVNEKRVNNCDRSHLNRVNALFNKIHAHDDLSKEVEFKTSDGSSVYFNRSLLVMSSDYYSGLVSNKWVETKKNNSPSINIEDPNISKNTLLHYQTYLRKRELPPQQKIIDLMQLFALADFLQDRQCIKDLMNRLDFAMVTDEHFDQALEFMEIYPQTNKNKWTAESLFKHILDFREIPYRKIDDWNLSLSLSDMNLLKARGKFGKLMRQYTKTIYIQKNEKHIENILFLPFLTGNIQRVEIKDRKICKRLVKLVQNQCKKIRFVFKKC